MRLLAGDESRRALLIERCERGRSSGPSPTREETLRIAGDVLRSLWRPPPDGHRFRQLAGLAGAWTEELPAAWERMRGWGIAHALAWDGDEDMIACARWLAVA